MTEASGMAKHVRDALSNLYDPVHLQVHPLLDLVQVPRRPGETMGEALRKLLWDTIESLKPPPSVPATRPEWVSYRLLSLLYVDLSDQTAVQRELGLGERTFYRRLQEAVEAVASVLWQSHRADSEEGMGGWQAGDATGQPPAQDKALHLIQQGRHEQVSLQQSVSTALDTLRPLMAQRDVGVRVSEGAEQVVAWGDPAILHQVFVNLLLAGIELVRDDSLWLDVSVGKDQASWILGGLRPPTRDDEDSALATVSLCRQLARSCGGELQVVEDQSCEAHFELSLATLRPMRILVVDDDADARDLLRRMLHAHGYSVVEASGSEGVLGQMALAQPDAILMDVLMPHQDGWRLLQELKMRHELADVPVLICSVVSQPDLAMALGAAEVVQKPFTEDDLMQALERCLHGAHSAEARN